MVLVGYLTAYKEWVDEFGTRKRQITLLCAIGGATQELQIPWVGPWPLEDTPERMQRKFSITVALLKEESADG